MDNNTELQKYGSYEIALQLQNQNESKVASFKKRLMKFANVKTLEEAKELAPSVIPTRQNVCSFYVGNAKCVVVNKEHLFRVSLDTENEFICYSFEWI